MNVWGVIYKSECLLTSIRFGNTLEGRSAVGVGRKGVQSPS